VAHLPCFQLLAQQIVDFQVTGLSIWLWLALPAGICPQFCWYMATDYFEQFSEKYLYFFSIRNSDVSRRLFLNLCNSFGSGYLCL